MATAMYFYESAMDKKRKEKEERKIILEQERQRQDEIVRKVNERREFTAYCQCPVCDFFDVHGIMQHGYGCVRKCQKCGFAWSQR